MRRILLVLACLFVFNMYGNRNFVMNKELIISSLYQKGDWERLGSISAISQYGERESFGLFVRIIGGREYYQVRPLFNKNGYIPKYSVTRGNYTYKGAQYNAKFSVYSTTYYFNI